MMPHPVFITKPEETQRLVWNDLCLANLAAYVTRKEIKALGKPAVIVKGCDERALVVLEQESQFTRDAIYVIGMACDSPGASGMGDPRTMPARLCAASASGTAQRTISPPTSASSEIWRRVAATSRVSVLVIDCTATGASPPIGTAPTWICLDSRLLTRRYPSFDPPVDARQGRRDVVVGDDQHQHQQHDHANHVDGALALWAYAPAADRFDDHE